MITIHPHFSILYHSNDQRKNIEQLIQKIKNKDSFITFKISIKKYMSFTTQTPFLGSISKIIKIKFFRKNIQKNPVYMFKTALIDAAKLYKK